MSGVREDVEGLGDLPGNDDAATRTHLTLVRHGQTVWHADNRYAGHASDVDLTDEGVQQATDLAQWVATQHFDAVVTSPVRRAVETARPSATVLGKTLKVVDALREVDFGVAEGRTIDELRDLDADMVRRFRADPVAHPFPGAESFDVAAERAAHALRTIAREHLGGKVLVVAHNTLLRIAMCALLELPVTRYRVLFPQLENAAITELVVPAGSGPASLLRLNGRPGP
ncbi:histidine phosphatase family protein [uncultured Jatrophihabitans sp.]|uniref:histidine phosphatase family protein n=1 Tax=uncultured Jatrophihabitans sp. TaxID=1610747 RepID=UPI0035CBC52B